MNFILTIFLALAMCLDRSPHFPTVEAPIYQPFHHFGHTGIDIIVKVGTSIFAVNNGIVIETAEDSKTYGRYIMILLDDGNAALYGHLSEIHVRVGDRVRWGQVIGKTGGAVGSDGAGQSKGYHLHFEIRSKGHLQDVNFNIDPEIYLHPPAIKFVKRHFIYERTPL